MKLNEMIEPIEVIVEDDFEEDEADTVEGDLSECLRLLNDSLIMMEKVKVKGGKIIRVPRHLGDLMEEVAEFLDQWEDYSQEI